jgi:hypothetical protein
LDSQNYNLHVRTVFRRIEGGGAQVPLDNGPTHSPVIQHLSANTQSQPWSLSRSPGRSDLALPCHSANLQSSKLLPALSTAMARKQRAPIAGTLNLPCGPWLADHGRAMAPERSRYKDGRETCRQRQLNTTTSFSTSPCPPARSRPSPLAH